MRKGWIISILILILIVFLIVHSVTFLLKDAKSSIYENKCKVVYNQPGERNIVLRIDDIQAYYLRDIQIRMIEDTLRRNRTVSLAVIPLGLNEDKTLITFLEENRCNLEIGLHGYNNSDYEFSTISYKEADKKIVEGKKILKSIENNLVTFIPPNNECSDAGREAVYDNGFKIISSGFKNEEYGYSTSTYDWKNKTFNEYNKVLLECEKKLDEENLCIIMIHPQDYTTNGKFDNKKYDNYISLLDGLDRLNATTITFRDLYYGEIIQI